METNHKADRENVLSKSSANQNNTLDSGTETLSPPSFLLKIGDSKIEEGPESSESIKSNYNFDAPEQPINNGSSNSGISQLKSNGGLQDDT